MCRTEEPAQEEVSVRRAAAGERKLKAMCKKTRMCKFFQTGTCNRMTDCSFAHSEEELTTAPDLSRTKLCQSLLIQGICTNARCTFAHSKLELRQLTKRPSCQVQQPGWRLQHANIGIDKCFEPHHSCYAELNRGADNAEDNRLLPDEAANPFVRLVSAPAEPMLRVKNTFLTWDLPAELCCPCRSQSAPPQLTKGASTQASDRVCKSRPLNASVSPMDLIRAKSKSPPRALAVSPWGKFRPSSPPRRARRPSTGGAPKLM
mmetsp:Transcript_31549/g.61988  ORF Transcript_31549/g.61988 Transcript_31549/m.61988 type:complete len:261 (-) Transcript_31549:185-967(-)